MDRTGLNTLKLKIFQPDGQTSKVYYTPLPSNYEKFSKRIDYLALNYSYIYWNLEVDGAYIYWIDEDGDEVDLEDDEQYQMFLDRCAQIKKRIFIKKITS